MAIADTVLADMSAADMTRVELVGTVLTIIEDLRTTMADGEKYRLVFKIKVTWKPNRYDVFTIFEEGVFADVDHAFLNIWSRIHVQGELVRREIDSTGKRWEVQILAKQIQYLENFNHDRGRSCLLNVLVRHLEKDIVRRRSKQDDVYQKLLSRFVALGGNECELQQ